MKSAYCYIISFVFITGLFSDAQAQINVGKLKEKVPVKKESEKEKPKENAEKTTPNNSNVGTTTASAINSKKLEQVNALRTKLAAENKFKISTYIDNKMSAEEFAGGVLSFTNDYEKPQEDKIEFGGKDFVYARLKLPKKITEYLDKSMLKNLIYFRVKNKINVFEEYGESEDFMQTIVLDQFDYAYNTNDVLIPIVPERNYYDDVIAKYKVDQKFENAKTKKMAYLDALARIRPADALQFLAKQQDGQYIIEVSTEITAKMKGSDFKKIENLKGYFLITLDNETRERYEASYNILANRALYNEYEQAVNNCDLEMQEEAEKNAMAKMTPREKELYLAQKVNPEFGLMQMYEGAKAEVKFTVDQRRTNPATIVVKWPDAGPRKEGGAAVFSVGGNIHGNRNVQIPVGAKVSVNGRTLIESVKGGENVMIYWWH